MSRRERARATAWGLRILVVCVAGAFGGCAKTPGQSVHEAQAAWPDRYQADRSLSVDPSCVLPTPTVFRDEPDAFDAVWNVADAEPFFASGVVPESVALARYHDEVIERWGIDFAAPIPPFADANRAWIGPVSCLDASLLAVQAEREDLLATPTEFGAFVLERRGADDRRELRIYFGTRDRPGLKIDGPTVERVVADQEAGWRLVAHLHNHNFFVDADALASPAPSAPDVHFARHFRDAHGLEAMWVTNGFETIRVPTDEIDGFDVR